MKRVYFVFLALLLLANLGFGQSRKEMSTNLKRGTLTPDGYLGKVGLDFSAGFESASGDHTNVTDREIQDMSLSNFNLGVGLIYPATQNLTFRLNLGFINYNTNWEGNFFLDEHDFEVSGVKMNFGVRVYLK